MTGALCVYPREIVWRAIEKGYKQPVEQSEKDRWNSYIADVNKLYAGKVDPTPSDYLEMVIFRTQMAQAIKKGYKMDPVINALGGFMSSATFAAKNGPNALKLYKPLYYLCQDQKSKIPPLPKV